MWTPEDIKKANEAINATDIGRGKEYTEVFQRIKGLRMVDAEASIETEMISNENGVCVFRAIVKNASGKVMGTGTAYEKEGSTFINKTSYIENCETSAVGRALAMCGIGIDVSIASKEEVENAKANQNDDSKKPNKADDSKKKANDKKPPVKEAKAPEQKKPTGNEKDRVMAFAKTLTEKEIDELCAWYKVESLDKMTIQQCGHYIKFISDQGRAI